MDDQLPSSASSALRTIEVTWDRVQEPKANDRNMVYLMSIIESGFPTFRYELPSELRDYHHFRHHFYTVDGIIPYKGSLELRRKYLSLVQMYKIILGYCDINCHHYFDIIGLTRTRSKHEYKIRPKVARTNYFKYSFFYRYINDWNSLPSVF